MTRFASLLLALGMLAACSPQGEATTSAPVRTESSKHPVSGLEVVPLTVTSGGKRHKFRVEVAASDAEQGRGLMFRTELGPDEGMIFPRKVPTMASFWMKNTPLPLDIIFIGPDGRIINIAARTTPYSLDLVNSQGPTSAVLELIGGRTEELGIKAGDSVEWQGHEW
ncbi:MAG: DUF192 domain-containing protein [Sphingomonadaceae bacterium]|nr:DUF192 domain-containing protein [Sphingomonadaceae bacterium]